MTPCKVTPLTHYSLTTFEAVIKTPDGQIYFTYAPDAERIAEMLNNQQEKHPCSA